MFLLGARAEAPAAGPRVGAAPESARYHAFDRARALAMLMGVVYHTLLFPKLIGGMNRPIARSGWNCATDRSFASAALPRSDVRRPLGRLPR